jgi:hypothetical protein
MMQRPSLFTALLFLPFASMAQRDTLVDHYLRTITQQDLREHLEVLASDAYEGRETGFKGQKMAAEYLRTQFAAMGIPPVPGWEEKGLLAPGYEQSFLVDLIKPGGVQLEVDGKRGVYLEDHFYLSEHIHQDVDLTEVIFVGHGQVDKQGDPYAGVTVKDKAVLVMAGQAGGKKDEPGSGFFTNLSLRSMVAKKAGARVMFYATPALSDLVKEFGHYLGGERMELKREQQNAEEGKNDLQVIIIDQATAERMLAKGGLRWKKAEKAVRKGGVPLPCPVSLRLRPNITALQAENVLGYIEGTDLKEELVVVTAHYDHIGTEGTEVYNGADDDGSGTVALLEMAQAFARAKADGHGPRRSVLFMPVSGEEKGLLGSEYYSDHPVFPLANTVADLNIDMIGRIDTAHTASKPYVYIIGSDRLSTDLHRINEEANSTYVGLDLDYTFNATNDPNRFYYRSDHYNFARYGVPVIFYFSGVHEDYHQPGDEVQKILFDLLERRARLVFATAWELTNRTSRIVVDKPLPKEK